MFFMDGVYILINVIIVDLTQANLILQVAILLGSDNNDCGLNKRQDIIWLVPQRCVSSSSYKGVWLFTLLD